MRFPFYQAKSDKTNIGRTMKTVGVGQWLCIFLRKLIARNLLFQRYWQIKLKITAWDESLKAFSTHCFSMEHPSPPKMQDFPKRRCETWCEFTRLPRSQHSTTTTPSLNRPSWVKKGPLDSQVVWEGLGLSTRPRKARCKSQNSLVQIPKNPPKSPKLRVTFHAQKPVVTGVLQPGHQGTAGSQPGTPSYSRVFLDTEEMKQRVKDRSNRLVCSFDEVNCAWKGWQLIITFIIQSMFWCSVI